MEAHGRASRGGTCFWLESRIPFVLFALVCLGLTDLKLPASQAVKGEKRTEATSDRSSDFSGPQELLEMLGVTEKDWNAWRDNQPLTPDENARLLGLLFHLTRFHPAEWQLWQARDVPPGRVIKEPDGWRGMVLGFVGVVERYGRARMDPDALARFELKQVYQVDLRIKAQDGTPRRVRMIARRLPDAWHKASAVGERVLCRGIFVKANQTKVDEDAEPIATLWLVGPAPNWYPTKPHKPLGITTDQTRLAEAGFDVGLLDQARKENNRGLGQGDRECFLQLLRSVARLEAEDQAEPGVDEVITLLREPRKWVGRKTRLRGRARRVAKIFITDFRDQQRLGFDSYYQLDLFVDLEGARIEIKPSSKSDARAEKPIVLADVYPATICTVNLPESIRRAMGDDLAVNLNSSVVVDGYFMKLWAYHSTLVAKFGDESRQAVPLIMATRVEMIEPPKPNHAVGIAIGIALLSIGGLVWFYIWKTSKSDRAFRRKYLQSQSERTEPVVEE